MEFYSPYQQRKPSNGTVTTAQQPKASAPPGTLDENGNPVNGYRDIKSQSFGPRLTVEGLADPGWGRGETFQANARPASINALKSSMSTANPDDYAGMDEMRSYLRNYLGDLPGNTQNNISSFDTQAQRGLSNLLSQNRTQNAGRGTLGSRQQMSAQGDITSRATSDYMNGLIKARADALDQAMKVGGGLSNLQSQDLSERKFQLGQGQALSDVILQLMNADQGREAQLSQTAAAQDAANKGFWGSIIGGGATTAGLLLSDRRAKVDAKPVTETEALRPFRQAKSHTYRYRDENAHGEGVHVSPMAQDLIKAGMGDCVTIGSDGFMVVNYGRALGRMFAAISALTDKIDRLEGRKANAG